MDRTEWTNWLSTIKDFFNSYRVATIFNKIPCNDPRPYVKVIVDNYNLEFYGLLDSGSAVSILGSNSHVKLLEVGFSLYAGHVISVIAAGGHSYDSLGYILVPIVFEGMTKCLKLHVIPQIDSTLILGIDFWKDFRICPRFLPSIDY